MNRVTVRVEALSVTVIRSSVAGSERRQVRVASPRCHSNRSGANPGAVTTTSARPASGITTENCPSESVLTVPPLDVLTEAFAIGSPVESHTRPRTRSACCADAARLTSREIKQSQCAETRNIAFLGCKSELKICAVFLENEWIHLTLQMKYESGSNSSYRPYRMLAGFSFMTIA